MKYIALGALFFLAGCTLTGLGFSEETPAAIGKAMNSASAFLPPPWNLVASIAGGIILTIATPVTAIKVKNSEPGKILGPLRVPKK